MIYKIIRSAKHNDDGDVIKESEVLFEKTKLSELIAVIEGHENTVYSDCSICSYNDDGSLCGGSSLSDWMKIY